MLRVPQNWQSHRWLSMTIVYASYLGITVLALIDGLLIWRQTLMVLIYSAFGDDLARLLYVAALILLSIGLMGGILACEPYLRNGLKRGVFGRRVLYLVGILAAIGIVGIGLPLMLPGG